jgi:hypothetical protein
MKFLAGIIQYNWKSVPLFLELFLTEDRNLNTWNLPLCEFYQYLSSHMQESLHYSLPKQNLLLN